MCDICSTMPQQGSYYRRKRVLSALFKDRWNVKSLLKEGAHFSGKEQKVLFWEKFQKKVNETIRSKKKKFFLKEYTNPHRPTVLIIMDPISSSFHRSPIPVHWYGRIYHTKIKGSCQEMAKENFIRGEGEVNWNHNPYVTSIISLKPKIPDLLNLSNY